MLGLSIHDLAVLRVAHGEPNAVLDARLLDRSAGDPRLRSGLTATLFAYATETKYNSWRARWLGPQRIVEVSFPVSFTSSTGSTLEVHIATTGSPRPRRWSGRNETGFRHEWLHVHDVVQARRSLAERGGCRRRHRADRTRRANRGRDTRPSPSGGRRVAFTAAGWAAAVHAPIVERARTEVRAVRVENGAQRRTHRLAARCCRVHDRRPRLRRVDTVIVAGPPATHAVKLYGPLDDVDRVLVEKPLATTLADADQLVERGDQIGYLENWAFAPVVRASIRPPLATSGSSSASMSAACTGAGLGQPSGSSMGRRLPVRPRPASTVVGIGAARRARHRCPGQHRT